MELPKKDLIKYLKLTLDQIKGMSLQEYINFSLKITLGRSGAVHILSTIVHQTSESGNLLYGRSFIPLLTSFIPRFIFPTKPSIVSFGNEFARKYGLISYSDYTTVVNIPLIAEFYMNFSIFGVLNGPQNLDQV